MSCWCIVAKRLDGSGCHLVRKPRSRRHCVRWGPRSPRGKGQSSPHFSAHFALARSPISAPDGLLFCVLLCTGVDIVCLCAVSISLGIFCKITLFCQRKLALTGACLIGGATPGPASTRSFNLVEIGPSWLQPW